MKRLFLVLILVTIGIIFCGCDEDSVSQVVSSAKSANTTSSVKAKVSSAVSAASSKVASSVSSAVNTNEDITISNNADFAYILSTKNEADPKIEEFSKKYYDRTVEFDGNIASVANHESYTTRYDILINSGDYNGKSVSGPNFKFINRNTAQLVGSGLYLPNFVKTGSNIHILANVGRYDPQTQIFELVSKKITQR